MAEQSIPSYPFIPIGERKFSLDPTVPEYQAYQYLQFMGTSIGATLDGGSQVFNPLFVMNTMNAARELLDPVQAQSAFIRGLEDNTYLDEAAKELSLRAAQQTLTRLKLNQQT